MDAAEPVLAGRPVPSGSEPDTRPSASPGSVDHELKSLAFAARNGDERAAELLIARLRPMILRYCRARLGRIVGGYHTADDVAQEACVGVLRALPRYRDIGKPFTAFAIRIAANKVSDAQRRAFVVDLPIEDVPDRPDEQDGPEERAVRGDEAAHARALLDRLPEMQREIILLRVVVGLSAKETGDIFDLTASAVRLIQYRALLRVRGMASDHGSP